MQNNKYGVDNHGDLINTESFEVVTGPTLIVNHKELKPSPEFTLSDVEQTLAEMTSFLEDHCPTADLSADEPKEE